MALQGRRLISPQAGCGLSGLPGLLCRANAATGGVNYPMPAGVERLEIAAQDTDFGSEQACGRIGRACRSNAVRDGNLMIQNGPCLMVSWLWIAIARRTRFENVGDVNLIAFQVNRFDHFVNCPSRLPTKAVHLHLHLRLALHPRTSVVFAGLPSPKQCWCALTTVCNAGNRPNPAKCLPVFHGRQIDMGSVSAPKSDGSSKSDAAGDESFRGMMLVMTGDDCAVTGSADGCDCFVSDVRDWRNFCR